MDLSPTDLQLVSFDLYKTDEKYNFKLTDILRLRHRPIETVPAYPKSVRAMLGVSTRTAIVSVVHNLRDDCAAPP